MNAELRDGIGQLLLNSGQVHYQAFGVSDGADPEWPTWYAEYTKDTFAEQLGFMQVLHCPVRRPFLTEKCWDSDSLFSVR